MKLFGTFSFSKVNQDLFVTGQRRRPQIEHSKQDGQSLSPVLPPEPHTVTEGQPCLSSPAQTPLGSTGALPHNLANSQQYFCNKE